ncbi:MAG TPA: hypothetical protein VMN36_17955 [Verrucomicrobiales bacterium]|nr:hypothetical protein [Verrucomicrobiales bacterium]
MRRFEWKVRGEDGGVWRWRADRHGARWALNMLAPGGEEQWESVEPPPRAMLEALRETIFRKYQRRRVPWEYVKEIEALLEELGSRTDDGADGELE